MEFEQTINSTCNSIYRLNRTNSERNTFFYTYEYTLDLIFKEFAGYFTILIVVNLIFKTEESWKIEKLKKILWKFVRESNVLIGRLEIQNYGWKTGIMDDRTYQIGWNYSRKAENWPKSRISTETPKNDENQHKNDENQHKNDINWKKNDINRSKNRNSTEKPKIDRKANNLPKIRKYHRENWNYDQNWKIDLNGYNDLNQKLGR